MYTLGQRYHGAARRKMKPCGNEGPSSARSGRQAGHKRNRFERPSPLCMRGVKGCLLSGQDYLAKQRHTAEEVTAALEKLMAKHPDAVLIVEDLSSICVTVNMEEEKNADEHLDRMQWDESSRSDDEDIVYPALREGSEIEQERALNAFLHGWEIQSNDSQRRRESQIHIAMQQQALFDGLKIGTWATCKSGVSMRQYAGYCRSSNRPQSMKPIKNRSVSGFRGRRRAIDLVFIQFPFEDLKIFVYVFFLVLNEYVLKPLSMKDMIENGLYISIQGQYVSLGQRRRLLSMENYFLKHRWKLDDTDFLLYTENELRTLHRTFDHLSLKALELLLHRAYGPLLDAKTVKVLEKSLGDCRT